MADRDHFTESEASERDARDPLRAFRDRFFLPEQRLYFDGNSLGPASVDAEAAVHRALADWKRLGIDGWLSGDPPWFTWAEQVGAAQASLVGAESDEVVVTGGTTINLHALVATFYQPVRRRRILADALNFPSDLYALRSQIELRGGDPRAHLALVSSRDGRTLDEAAVIAAMAEDVALAILPSVLYRSGQLLDIPRLTAAAHERGLLIGFDCSHSAGAVPHRLHDWGVDFAFWCNYKYVNGGPGAIASLYVHRRHHGQTPALAGWWGSDKQRQFDLSLDFERAAGAGAWQIGTPPILSLAAVAGALSIHLDAGIERIRQKSLALTGYLMGLADTFLGGDHGFVVGTPREPDRRGGHVALEHPDAVQLCRALKARGIVPDFRPPNVIRLAPAALYTRFADCWQAIHALREIVETGEHRRQRAERNVVA
jgi:kynureninase